MGNIVKNRLTVLIERAKSAFAPCRIQHGNAGRMRHMKLGFTATASALQKRPMLQSLALAAIMVSGAPADASRISPLAVDGERVAVRFDGAANMAPHPAKRIHSISVAIPPVARGLSLPPVEGPRDASRPLVVIDAGHGGHDPGAINRENGGREKDVTLAIAQAIRDRLVRSGRVRVALTRDDDRFLVLQERYGIARKLNADLFISIHADSADNETARGATVYTLSETASDREAARLAARENKADVLNGVNLGGQSNDVSSILIDLTQRESMNISVNFARLLQREAAPYVPFRGAAHRFASLMVLKAPDTPSVLFETGYISNADDAAFLASKEGRDNVAKGVARAIEVHFARKLAMRGNGAGG
jgi:N-acetylmuramoyl-L-alanine amidase